MHTCPQPSRSSVEVSRRLLLIACAALAFTLMSANAAFAQTSTFTYQGRLTDAAMAANGTYDFQFAVYDVVSGGTQQPQPSPLTVTRAGVSVANGVFTVQLDFTAAAFPGADRYLEIQVKKPADASYTTLTPR